MNAHQPDAGPSSPRYRQNSQGQEGYSDQLLQPAYTSWNTQYPSHSHSLSQRPHQSIPEMSAPPSYSSYSPSRDFHPAPAPAPRERLTSSTSNSSLSSTLKGRRAPAPAALDLSPRRDDRYGSLGIGLGPSPESRRVRRASRPLPHPPNQSSLAPSAYTSPVIPQVPSRQSSLTVDENDPRASLDSYYLKPSSPLGASSPEQPDPSDIDRKALIGVGELATPRWGASSTHQHLRTPSMPFNLGSTPPASLPLTDNWAQGQDGVGLGFESNDSRIRPTSMSQAPIPPRLPSKSPAREKRSETVAAPPSAIASTSKPDDTMFSLGTLADFNFDSTMEAALAASLSMPETKSTTAPTPDSPARSVHATIPESPIRNLRHVSVPDSPISPGSARSRIYARRQERERAAAAHTSITDQSSQPPSSADSQTFAHRANLPQPPTSADSLTFAHRTPKDSRKTPPNQLRHSSHDILKQFAPKDFSHLPPSPSSASINQILKGSASVNNFGGSASTPPTSASGATSYFEAKSLQKSDSQRHRTATSSSKVDADTAEAMRKLDGISTTPGKSKPKPKTPIASRPGTPLSTKKKVPSRLSNGSLKDKASDSPLNTWVDIGEELPAVPIPRTKTAKRESSSSASFIGTPTSRDSHSLPTTSTTPSLSDVAPTKNRRASGGSDMSTPSITVGDSSDQDRDISVPPVPPLPKSYISMRQGMNNVASYVPVREEPSTSPLLSPPTQPAPTSQSSPETSTSPVVAPPKMNKKWSFSSALNLKASSSPVIAQEEPPRSPQTPWSEIHQSELPSPGLNRHESDDSQYLGTGKPAAKRLTPSSIPFFRRTSSNSTQSKVTPPETPKQSDTKIAPGSQSRKSVLGMHLPSMLRGSTSKRGLSQQFPAPVKPEVKPEPQTQSTGWTGRRRGKTLSISADPSKPFIPPELLKHKSSVESGLESRSSAASNRSESTINGQQDRRLPAIVGSPARPADMRPSDSSRNLPSITPTKIPRIANRAGIGSPHTSMPPPAMPSLRGKTVSSSMADLTRPPISEFGVVEGVIAPRQSTSSAHRAHLLAPMSARQETRRSTSHNRPSDPPTKRDLGPPSRRQLPQPPPMNPKPLSSVTAATLSSSAKRTSREFRGVSKRDSKETLQSQSWGSSGKTSPIKPSKSLHSKLSIPSTSRMSSSSSVGAPGTSFRKTSLVAESPTMSPADDEESLADAEMAAYIKRRRQRAAAGKKDDLTDINEFPEDTLAAEPMSQRAFVTRFLHNLSDFERKEVLDFDKIYYTPLGVKKVNRPPQPNGATYNHGYDDERGDYLVVEGDHLCYRYEVVGVLGKGSFGQVVQCRDHKTGQSVAVKIIRNKKRFHAQALVEVKILQQLVEWDPEDKHFMVRMTDSFSFRGHLCIITELLSINLYELIKANQFAGFTTVLIRRFTTQMLASLQLMRSHRIVHCDLKPENISLCHPAKSGIKVIDFGSSCLETEKVYTYIQSRFYRSPEVILGMNYAMAIDMWSLGCILAELYTGVPIFPGENEHEQLACIMEVLGVPERYIVEKASRRKLFFDATGSPRPFVNAKGRRRRPGTKSLAAVLKCDDDLFVDFISKCLTWDPDKRLKPQPAMRHPWILSGRKRTAIPPSSSFRSEERTTERRLPTVNGTSNSGLSLTSPSISLRSKETGTNSKSKLLISPPTPLMARQQFSSNFSPHTQLNNLSRVGGLSNSNSTSSGLGNGNGHGGSKMGHGHGHQTRSSFVSQRNLI
ncbi:uncharacterized protein I303_107380 [Kwoniella dejecticola CBS 10117]|uniref:Protein kinase domain-containing protein n=1 Tax=Kwoniella dejecticola CBS 10117 TaxID=1296121 RepID=A0AAJ8KVQ6_9TREE